jgi:hypothetical protein
MMGTVRVGEGNAFLMHWESAWFVSREASEVAALGKSRRFGNHKDWEIACA